LCWWQIEIGETRLTEREDEDKTDSLKLNIRLLEPEDEDKTD
jgi:hypothetical protein